jgi:two-component system, NarL family, invasion response regulator UvrY
MNETYKVIVADDHSGIRSGVREIIEESGEFEVVAEAENGRETLNIVKKIAPDLLILDVQLPDIGGPDIAWKLTSDHISTAILALSAYGLPDFVFEMIENGAQGYLTKEQAPELLLQAARDLMSTGEEIWIADELKEKIGINTRFPEYD